MKYLCIDCYKYAECEKKEYVDDMACELITINNKTNGTKEFRNRKGTNDLIGNQD